MILEYEIPKQFKVSTNKIYSWVHWTKRKKIADYYHNLVKEDCILLKQIEKKVTIEFKFYFKSRYLDSSNCSFMAKMLEDWLVWNWLLINDTNTYVWKFSIESIFITPVDRKKMEWDLVEIIIKTWDE